MYREITDERILGQLNGDKQLNNADLINANISAVTLNLANAHFEDAHLEGANLEGANLNGAVIRKANFTGANLKKTKFENIEDFSETHFNDAKCNKISFTGSELKGGDFTNTNFENTEFFNVNFRNSHLDGANFVNCFFQDCNFSETDLKGAHFNDSTFENCDIIETHLENADFSNARFTRIVFEGSFFEGTNFQGVINEYTIFEIDKLSKKQRVQLGFPAESLINNLNKPNPDIQSLIELVRSDEWDTKELDQYGNNALIVACLKGFEDVAVELIKTGKFNIYFTSSNGTNAFKVALEKNLTKVLDALPKNVININETGFDTINQENIVIGDYLKQNPYNLVFMINNSYYFTTRDIIKKQLNNSINIKYGCKKAGEGSQFVLDSNIIYDTPYLSLSSLFGLQILIKSKEAKKIIDLLSGNMFILKKSITLPAIISENFIDGGAGMSADHCQSGKETDVYDVFIASPDCGKSKLVKEVSDGVEESKDNFSGTSNKVTLLYKEIKYPISINADTSVDELKELFLDELISNQIIENKNFNVRFLFKGKILKDDLPGEIKEKPSDFVIQAVVNSKLGGRRKKGKNKKTMKKGKKRNTFTKGKNRNRNKNKNKTKTKKLKKSVSNKSRKRQTQK